MEKSNENHNPKEVEWWINDIALQNHTPTTSI